MDTSFIHDVYTSAADILVAFKARCMGTGIDIRKFRWIGSDQAPDFDSNDPEVVVVLDITLDTLFDTFCFAWEWITAGSVKVQWHGNLARHDHGMRLREGVEPFEPFTLRWRRIKLDTHLNESAMSVDRAKAPGVALLYVAAQHPERTRVAMSGGKEIHWVASAIQCHTWIPWDKRPGWNAVPCLSACEVISASSMWLSVAWEWDYFSGFCAPLLLD